MSQKRDDDGDNITMAEAQARLDCEAMGRYRQSLVPLGERHRALEARGVDAAQVKALFDTLHMATVDANVHRAARVRAANAIYAVQIPALEAALATLEAT